MRQWIVRFINGRKIIVPHHWLVEMDDIRIAERGYDYIKKFPESVIKGKALEEKLDLWAK